MTRLWSRFDGAKVVDARLGNVIEADFFVTGTRMGKHVNLGAAYTF